MNKKLDRLIGQKAAERVGKGWALRPNLKAARSRSAAAGGKTTWRREAEGITILSEKCSNCGKTAKEIERKWEGKD